MFDALRKRLEEVVADVNPFDNGQTGASVRNDRDRASASEPNLEVANKGEIPRTQRPYRRLPMEIGTIDKPIILQQPPRTPAANRLQVPENLYNHYSLYNLPNGTQTLESDDYPGSPVIPFGEQQPKIDQPYIRKKMYNVPSANPQLRRHLETKITPESI